MACLVGMRKRRGFFERYPKDGPLDLVGLINCPGCFHPGGSGKDPQALGGLCGGQNR
ncbi:hypothetical protein DFAR_2450004 [Desulfarculales bacterium]